MSTTRGSLRLKEILTTPRSSGAKNFSLEELEQMVATLDGRLGRVAARSQLLQKRATQQGVASTFNKPGRTT